MTSLWKRIRRNAGEPITIPRWLITLKYFLFIVTGTLAFFTGVPSLELTTFAGYEPIWSLFVGIGAIVAFAGSLEPKTRLMEVAGAATVVAFLTVLIISFNIRGSFATALLLTMVAMLPTTRAAAIMRRWMRGLPEGEPHNVEPRS